MELTDGQIISIAGTLVGAIVVLWRQMHTHQKDVHDSLVEQHVKTEKELQKCNEGHQETNRQMLEFSREMGELKGRQAGIESLSTRVLNEVHAAITDRGNHITTSQTGELRDDPRDLDRLPGGGLDLGEQDKV